MTDRQDGAMTDVHDLSGAYAVDALDPEERANFEEHLRRCTACRAEVDSLREATAAMASDAEADPPATLRDSVLAGIEAVRPVPPLPSAAPPAGRRPRRIRPFRGSELLMAAAVALIAALGAVVWQPWSDTDDTPPTAAERVLTAPDATRASQTLPDGAKATLVVSRSQAKAVILTDDMAPAPTGKVYELWLQSPDGDMLPAGLMPDEPDTTVVLEGDASRATAVGITIEPAGGSPQPTSEPILLFDLRES